VRGRLVLINYNQFLCGSVKLIINSNSFHAVIIASKENSLIGDFTLLFIENVITILV